MTTLERDVRADERSAVLTEVETALFRFVIGTSADDPAMVAEHNTRMKAFMRLSDGFARVFPDWPNR